MSIPTDCPSWTVALTNLMLVRGIPDASSRVANGFDTRLFCLLKTLEIPIAGCCDPLSDFAAMCANDNPLATLPVIFSSSEYRSTRVQPLVYANFASGTEFWIGPTMTQVLNYTNAKETTDLGTQYFACCGSDGLWYFPTTLPFRSVPGTVIFYQYDKVRTKKGNVTGVLGDVDYDVVDLFLSGDGSTYFKLSGTPTPPWSQWAWSRWDGLKWVQFSFYLARGETVAICASFDGNYSCIAGWTIASYTLEVTVYLQSNVFWRTSISSVKKTDGYMPYMAMINKFLYVACGFKVFTITDGSSPLVIRNTTHVCTGIWTKGQAIWVGTTHGTEMSTDQGWSWTFQPDFRAVNAGLYMLDSNLALYISDPTAFQDDVQYPLELTNRGLLRSADGWSNVFELKDGKWRNGSQVQDNDAFTVVDRDTRYATSPNGLFLLDNPPNGDVVLYFNVWKTAKFQEWCAANSCNTCLAKYCDLLQEPDCQTGSVDPIPFTPTPTTPAKPFPTWAIGLIVGLVVTTIIVGIVVSKKKKIRH